MYIIADIGNNHFGDKSKFLDLVYAAHESGADCVKSVFYDSPYAIKGSMPFEFYRDCMISLDDMEKLRGHVRSDSIEFFFTYAATNRNLYDRFSSSLHQKGDYLKSPAIATERYLKKHNMRILSDKFDKDDMIISFNEETLRDINYRSGIVFDKSCCLYATPYCGIADYFWLAKIKEISTNYGISHHAVGFGDLVQACKQSYYDVSIVEKHFTLKNNESWNGQIFRDTVHGLDPVDFKDMVEELKS